MAALLLVVTDAAALVWTFTSAGAAPAFATGTLPANHILLPTGPARSVVMLFSGIDGWDQTDEALADRLVTRKAAVVGVDLPRYLANLALKTEDCHYLISDIESLSNQIQRVTGGTQYRPPILAGIDVGGGLALDLLDQTPAATIGSTVVSDPAEAVPLDRPLCTAAIHTEDDVGAVYALPTGTLADPVTVRLSPAASATSRARAETFAADASGAEVSDGSGSAAALLGATLSAEVDKLASAPKTPAVRVTATSTI